MRIIAVVAAAASLSALIATPAPAASEAPFACTRHAVDGEADAFFAKLKAGDVLAALQDTLGTAPMMQGRQADLETLTRQIQTATDIYGPVRNQSCVREVQLGSMVLRRQYIAQHDKMLTRWTMIFARLPGGWQALQVSYEDQVNSWFE